MRVIKPGEKLTKKELEYFSEMASRAYLNDPVHMYATADPEKRKKYVYHFMMERLHTSSGQDYIFIDDENRGICVWRKAHNEYTAIDFLKCSHWINMWLRLPNTIRTLSAYGVLDVKKFDENTWIISPVFVSPEHQGEGVATELITKSIEMLSEKNYRFGLEVQNKDNIGFYEKLGFKIFEHDYFKPGNIDHYYMIYEPEKG